MSDATEIMWDVISGRVLDDLDGREWRPVKAQHTPEPTPVFVPSYGSVFGADDREYCEGAD